ncbi:Uncharacterised protein [Neisseria meningitidis]|nr:Uncharacterised protein [Neisseria meningitidis]CWN71004.1 Uncharacterised protein [Neisseria meningitidis]CWP57968.1 Uncharacterised protein [Neisseria meningitidis]CWQ23521.1 Uncharacterised protein [Neisseria meningitidis]CWQ26819.1 Uncharacterised protein [Neisseria meningitidis]
MSGGIEAQVFSGIQINLQALQQFGAVDGFKFGMFGQETFDLQLVFFRQHAAGGVHQAALRFHQFGCGIEDAVLLFQKVGHGLGGLAVFEVGIAAQRA